jgi:rfaE bifunctional protein kinase chain/domain
MIESILSAPVLIVGDVMLDEYHWCDVTRISPEAPVPICHVNKTTHVPGGAANVANNIQALGGTAFLLGMVGQDSSAEKFFAACSSQALDTSNIIKSPTRPTVLKSRVIARGQHVIRLDREDKQELSAQSQLKLLNSFETLAKNVSGIILSDYAKGVLNTEVITRIIAQAKARNTPVIVDPKGHDYSKYKGASFLTPNFSEFSLAVGPVNLESEANILSSAITMIKDLQLEGLLITRSAKGMSLITKDGRKVDIPTRAKDVFDITGAGDTVIAVFAMGIAAGMTMHDSAELANEAAGIVVGKIGTSTVSKTELKDAMKQNKRLQTI